jgi:hypothetical protein
VHQRLNALHDPVMRTHIESLLGVLPCRRQL